MGINLMIIRDKARDLLHRASHILGETSGIKPASVSANSKARDSIAMDLPSIKALLPYETVNEKGFLLTAIQWVLV